MAGSGYNYDLFVIGGGSGGLAASKRAAILGKKVAVADFVTPSPAGTTWGLGGTCVNVGCIPKKLMHFAASVPGQIGDMQGLGWNTKQSHNWETMVNNIGSYIKGLNFGQRNDLRSKEVTYYNKFAKFIDEHTVELTDKMGQTEVVTADKFIIACGGRPNYGEAEGAREHCISSDDIFWMKKPPGKTLVVGASYIALECAGFLVGLGFDTTVMVRSILLRGFDQSIAERIGTFMEEEGCKFARKMVPTKFEKEGDKIVVYTKDGLFGKYDTVLMAVGRTGLCSTLNLEAAGVEYDKESSKIVPGKDHVEATNKPNIFAIGDILKGLPELTPVAIQAGQLLAERLYNNKTEMMDYTGIATTVFTPLEYGVVGLSEQDAEEQYGKDGVKVYHTLYKPLNWALNDKRPDCYLKAVVETKSGNEKILGLHICGINAAEIIQGYAVAYRLGMTKTTLDQTVGIHPCDSEVFTTLDTVKVEGVDLEGPGGC